MKVNRRAVLKMGIAASIVPLSAATVRAAAVIPGPGIQAEQNRGNTLDLYKIIYDERFSPSRRFAELSKQLGGTVAAIRGDVTDVWYNDLYFRWQEGPTAIAGLTSDSALFCLQQLARDVPMHVVYREQHKLSAGPQTFAAAAHRLAAYPRKGLQAQSPGSLPVSGWSPHDELQLVSWIIAPLAHQT